MSFDERTPSATNDQDSGGGPKLADSAQAVQKQGSATTTNTTTTTTIGSTTVTGLPLDWTQLNKSNTKGNNDDDDRPEPNIRYPLDVVESLDVTDGELVLVGTHGQKITHLGPDFGKIIVQALQDQGVSHLTKLILRSHVVQQLQGLHDLPEGLQVLEFYDNQVQALNLTPNMTQSLTILDMSYNAIRDMQPVADCVQLQELYLANNKLKAITGLSNLKHLRKVDLGANRIRVIPPEQLQGLDSLTELWLGKNKIEQLQGLEHLKGLKRLDVQSNRLRDIPADQLQVIAPTLEELYLAHNGLTEAGGLVAHPMPELIQLDISRNQFTSLNEFGIANAASNHFPVLEELWCSGNAIADWDHIRECVHLTALETIYLEYNPLQTTDPLYRKTLAQIIPHLKQIDATMINAPSAVGLNGLVVRPMGGTIMTEEERMRQYQEMAIQRAQQEEERRFLEEQQAKEDDSDDSGDEK